MITEIENVEAFDAAISKPNCSVVDFYATWCGPCKMIHPVYEELSKKYTTVSFYQINVDNVEDVVRKAGVSCMPTFKFYKNGELVDNLEGANRRELERLIEKNQ
ncbi:thioredoxin [Anaeromyces robustus]|uniref:Thioredoxin n=1 Tax=Anaeromyces robustus TaxID=1754192 RepID=A0A1Y1XLC5_9FUNG|nr:thioredoxin [Anaeromyces robustus]|eukprot:ORX86558.1 thioredoxin [Anaeromyces robustus]